MRIEIAALCDAATEQGGKLNMLGAFDTLHAVKFPHIVPQVTIVFRIRFNRAESGGHKIKLAIKDEEGVAILPEMEAVVPIEIRKGSDSRVGNIMMNVHGMKFEKAGYHSVDLSLDGTHAFSLPLRVIQVPEDLRQHPPL